MIIEKLKRQDIGEHLTAAANFTINQLPDILTECTIAFIPEMGHLLVTKKNDQIPDPNQLEYLGFQFLVISKHICKCFIFILIAVRNQRHLSL